MADTTESDNIQLKHLGFLSMVVIFFVAGLVIHSFIIGVNVNDWWKGRSVTPVDQIVTSLGISRMCAQCANTLYFFLEIMGSPLSLVITEVIYVFFAYANIWLTTLFSIVFCLKISNLHTRLFLYLKRMILHRTVHFIAVSIVLSVFSCSRHLSVVIAEVTNVRTYNTSVNRVFKNCTHTDYMYYVTIEDLIPLIFGYISLVLLFTSLYHHTTRMKMSSNLSINLETYYSAMRFVFGTFIYNTIYFVVDLMSSFYYYYYCVDLHWPFIVLEFLPVLHSSYLIYRTAKLRNQMSKVLHNVIQFLFHSKRS